MVWVAILNYRLNYSEAEVLREEKEIKLNRVLTLNTEIYEPKT